MQIRFAQPQDVRIIYQFVCELEATAFDFFIFEKLFIKNITRPNYFYLVAEIDKTLVGYLSCHSQFLLHHCGLVGEIQELFIASSHRNSGIGQALVSSIQQIANENNWINLEVSCNKKRINTHRFYRRLGFVDTHLKFVLPIK